MKVLHTSTYINNQKLCHYSMLLLSSVLNQVLGGAVAWPSQEALEIVALDSRLFRNYRWGRSASRMDQTMMQFNTHKCI